MIGKRIAHYEVTDKIGAGGMGEVYRARDTKLGRDVALKFLPDVFAADPDRLGRFEREAKLLASLNHPNIASIYGIESDGGKQVLVLELVEGEDLSTRIARGALPLDETLAIAAQVAVALEAAHEQGVIHRDLKPANIKVTPDGAVKVLDFGLAKALDTDPSDSGANLSHSPTVLGGSSPTVQGVILGTAAYMSPEQARGRAVDKRADIFAFGCVVFEMLTGAQAFSGETVSDTLASILAREPDLKQLPESTPRALRRLLERCLEKEAKKRLRDIGEARLAIDAIRRGDTGDEPAPAAVAAAPVRGRGGVAGWVAAAVFALAAAATWFMASRGGEPELMRVEISAPPDAPFELSSLHPGPATISPDGMHIAFSARNKEGNDVLWVRTLSDEAARPLSGTEGAGYPFWSPDGRTIGFIAQGSLKKVDIAGAPPFAIASAPVGKGGSWNADNVIIFAPTFNGPILKVKSTGGQVDTVTALNPAVGENSHRFPWFLPDGEHFLYFARSSSQGQNEQSSICVASLDGSVSKRLFACRSQAQYANGHILYLQDGTLMARPFDTGSLEFTGDPFALVGHVQFLGPASRGVFSASGTGRLVYLRGAQSPGANLVWLDRAGKEVGRLGDRAQYSGPAISPDGKSVAVEVTDPATGAWDIWTYDVARGIRSRFTFGPAATSGAPVWSPDGQRIAYRRDLVPEANIYIRSFAGTDTATALVVDKDVDEPYSWSADGRFLAFMRFGSLAGDIWVLPTAGGIGKPVPFTTSQFNEIHPSFAPDGDWLAYVSDESGRSEVYVAPYPGPGRKWQVSTGGGFAPRWRGDGREIFFATGDNKMAAVEIEYVNGSIAIGAVHDLFEHTGASDYDVTKDGERFLVVKEEGQVDEPITLILNWTELIPERK